MMYRARLSIAFSSFGWMRFPQKTWNPECRYVESMAIISLAIFPLAMCMQKTLCRKISSSFFSSRGGATRNMPLP